MLNFNEIRQLSNTSSGINLSLYLRVDPGYKANQKQAPAWQIYLKNALSSLNAEDEIHQAIHRHVETFFEGYSPQSKSLCLFASENGIIKHYELPIMIENHYAIGDIDLVPLLWSLDEYERYLVVLVDNEQARFLSAMLGHASTNEEMSIDFDDYDFGNKRFIHANHSGSADGLQGSGGENFEDMKDEHIRRFHSDVAGQIRTVIGDMQSERIILGGNERAAHQVKDLLHQSVRDQLVDILPIPLDASDSEVAKNIQDIALNYERSQELSLIDEVINLAKAGGRAVLGTDNVLGRLDMQQVELLILPYPMEDRNMAVQLSSMALECGAKIELVHGTAATKLREEGNACARLYYRINEPETV